MSDTKDNQLNYDAFISYRHCELDQFVAINLQKKLESFKVPKSVQKIVKSGKTRIERVFRDEDELPLSDDLSETINLALSNTEFLIVVCTSRLSESRWCLKEIEDFLKTHDRKHVLLVLAEGEPDESFPEILTHEEVQEKDRNGNVFTVRRSVEPLAADVRGLSKKEMLKAMDIAVIKLAAVIFGLNYDDLRRRHHEQKIKKLSAIWGTISAVILFFAIVCFFLLAKINAQKKEITEKYAGVMAHASSEVLRSGRRKDALCIARSVLGSRGEYNADSYRALAEAVAPYMVGDLMIPENVLEIKAPVEDFVISKAGKYAAIHGNNGESSIIDISSGRALYSFEHKYIDDALPKFGFDEEEGLIYSDEGSVKYLKLDDYSASTLFNQSGWVIAEEGSDVVVVITKSIIAGYRKGQCIFTEDLVEHGIECSDEYEYRYSFSPDKKYIAALCSALYGRMWAILVDIESGDIRTVMPVETKGAMHIATNGEYIYILEETFNFDDNLIYCVDSATADIVETINFGNLAAPSIKVIEDGLLISDNTSAVIKDTNTWETIAELYFPATIMDCFEYENSCMIVTYDGHIFLLGSEYPIGKEYEEEIMGIPYESKISQCKYQGGKFYYRQSDTNYIVVYGPNPSGNKEKREDGKTAYGDAFFDGRDAMNTVKNIKDIEMQYVYSAVYSNDKRHIAVVMADGILKIYSNNYSLEKTLYSFGVSYVSSFVYIKEEDIFVINSMMGAYILDKNLNYISKMDICTGYENGNFIVEKHENHYVVPYVPYDEMIKRADEIIGDYTINESVAERYGMTQ